MSRLGAAPWRVLVAAADPDDKVIGRDAQRPFLPPIHILHVLDGTPPDGSGVAPRGLPSRAACGAVRQAPAVLVEGAIEALVALSLAP